MEHHSSHPADAVTTPVVLGSDHQDIPSINTQQTQQEEHDQEDGHSLQLVDIASVPPVGFDTEITHTDTDLHHYSRQSC